MNAPANSALFRELPSVDELLRSPHLGTITPAMREAARTVLTELRAEIASGEIDSAALQVRCAGLPQAVLSHLERPQFSLVPVINATGVLLHTNLGRAPLSAAAIQHIVSIAASYSNLEYDLAGGERSRRDLHAQQLFSRLFAPIHCETIVVNNCAAATMLVLNSLADGGEVIVSRGELVEIGGSFRVPEIMAKSGAKLREVGTTNRTRISDYEHAITPDTRMLMRVSRSNFALVGFTEEPALEELVALARKHNIPFFEDHGNGALLNLQSLGVHGVHTVPESLRAGVDLVSYSGDKLLGGPQCGMITGRPYLIAALRANPFFRALRVDKLTYAALQATLSSYLQEDYDAVPVLRMLRLTPAQILTRAQNMQSQLTGASIIDGESVVGGGTPPTATLATHLLALSTPDPQQLASALRNSTPPVIARIQNGQVVLDTRTVAPEEDATLLEALKTIQS